jgi:hypothetical protein
VAWLSTAAEEKEVEAEAQEEVSQKVTEEAQTTAAGAAGTPEETQRPEGTQTPEAAQWPEETQRPQAAGTQEVSRKVSLEVRRFPTQEIPQELPYRLSQEDLTRYLPEDQTFQ